MKKKHETYYDGWIKNYSSLLVEFRLERQGIICLLEERDDMNKHIVKGKKRKDSYDHKNILATKIDNLSKDRKKFDYLIQSTNQLIISKKRISKIIVHQIINIQNQ